MKNVIKLETFYFLKDSEKAVEHVVSCNNSERYHESLDKMPSTDVYFGRTEEVKSRQERIKQTSLEKRRQGHRQSVRYWLYLEGYPSLNLP